MEKLLKQKSQHKVLRLQTISKTLFQKIHILILLKNNNLILIIVLSKVRQKNKYLMIYQVRINKNNQAKQNTS